MQIRNAITSTQT